MKLRGFIESPMQPMTLFMRLSDARAAMPDSE